MTAPTRSHTSMWQQHRGPHGRLPIDARGDRVRARVTISAEHRAMLDDLREAHGWPTDAWAIRACIELTHASRPRFVALPLPIVLVAELPSRRVAADPARWLVPDEHHPLELAWRLCVTSGLSVPEYLALFERVCLFDGWPGTPWPAREASNRARRLRSDLGGRHVVLLGRRLARAFGRVVRNLPLFTWAELACTHRSSCFLAVAPSPIGLARWWIDPGNQADALAFYRTLRARLVAPDESTVLSRTLAL